jgi:hypothetical protein
VFELQLMPTLISLKAFVPLNGSDEDTKPQTAIQQNAQHLDVVNPTLPGIEFGVVALFSCSSSCGPEQEGTGCWRKEYVFVQPAL